MECHYDRFNSDIKYVYTFRLDKCIEACEQTEACVDVSYVPGSVYNNRICYLKSAAQWGLLKMDVWGASSRRRLALTRTARCTRRRAEQSMH